MEHHTTAGFSVRAVDERAAADVRREVLGEEGEEDMIEVVYPVPLNSCLVG